MKATIEIEVKDQAEAEYIKHGLAHPEARASIIILGALLTLETTRAQQRVLDFVCDYFDEKDAKGV